jgi:putative membrane protein
MFKKIINKTKNNKVTTISIIAILFIPALYACNFISAFADPYSNLSDVAVAVVNDDKTVTYNGKEINIGNAFTDSMKESDKFKWYFVSEEEALQGMKNNTYYFTVRIPENFTTNIYSTLNGEVKEADLVYMVNDNDNYISGVLGGVLVNELNSQLNKEVISDFMKTLGINLENVEDLSIGVTALLNGSETLTSGLGELSGGINEIKSSTEKLSSESTKLSTGANELAKGYTTFNTRLSTLTNSLSQVKNGYSNLNVSMNQYLLDLTATINSSNLSDAEKNNIINNYKQILGTTNVLNNNLNNVLIGTTTLSSKSNSILENMNSINVGTAALTNYLNDLNNGTNRLYNGSLELYSGSKTLSTGLATLNTNVNLLNNSVSDLNLAKNASNLGAPVTTLEKPYSSVENYGYGFAPYFISLGLFVGALVTTIVLTIKKKKETAKEIMSIKNVAKRVGFFACVVSCQAVILDMILFATKIQVDNTIIFVLFSILIGIAFMALIQMLSTIFGDAGRFVSVIILILQLTACGGTFPIETAPKLYNALHNFMPMTYTVDGLRVIIGNGNKSILFNSIVILISIIIVCYGIIIIYFRKSKDFK